MNNADQKSLEKLFHSLNDLYPILEINSKKYQGLNIFNALHKENDEVRLHSRFLSFLLSPASSHNKGNFFLNSFLKIIKRESLQDEKYLDVYPNEENKSEKDKIDILIKGNKQALIIENKIHAGDSNTEFGGQIETYIDTVRTNGIALENISVVYLTPNGHEPSEESMGKYSDKKIHLLSYKREILNWLNECIKNLSQPEDIFLKECLNQYSTLLKKLTNYINMEDQQKLIDIISRNENLKSAKLLHDNFEEIKSFTISKFWSDLENQLKVMDFGEVKLKISNPKNSWIHFQTINKKELYIEHEKDEAIYWGIEKQDLVNTDDYDLEDFDIDDNRVSKYFDFKNEYEIILNNFNADDTFCLINDKYRKKRIKNMVDEIKDYVDRLGL